MVIALPLIFAECAHTELPAQAVTPAPVGKARLPLEIAVFADPSFTIHPPLGFYEKLNPGIANTVRDALDANLDTVVVVAEVPSAGDADLLAIPTVDVNPDPDMKHPPLVVKGGHQIDKLTVTFLEPGSRTIIAELSSLKPFSDDAPGIHSHMVSYYGMTAAVRFCRRS